MQRHKPFHRTERVSAHLRREVGRLVHDAVRNAGLPSVSVSDVEVSRDLAHAKVFVTALSPEHAAAALAALREHARGFRFALGKVLRMRHVPELHFHYDDSVDRGERIDMLLRQTLSTTDDDR